MGMLGGGGTGGGGGGIMNMLDPSGLLGGMINPPQAQQSAPSSAAYQPPPMYVFSAPPPDMGGGGFDSEAFASMMSDIMASKNSGADQTGLQQASALTPPTSVSPVLQNDRPPGPIVPSSGLDLPGGPPPSDVDPNSYHNGTYTGSGGGMAPSEENFTGGGSIGRKQAPQRALLGEGGDPELRKRLMSQGGMNVGLPS